MAVIYHEADASLAALRGQQIGLFGFDGLGEYLAGRLRERGVAVMVSGTEADLVAAQLGGYPVMEASALMRQVTVVLLALPDDALPGFYMREIAPHLRRHQALIFTSSYLLAFGFIEPPPFVDVGLIALRLRSQAGGGAFQSPELPGFIGVSQDASQHAWEITLGVALAVGALRAGALEVSIEQEAELSLFIQQAILPAILQLMTSAAHLLMEQGYPPEAVFTDLYLTGKFPILFEQMMRQGIWPTLEAQPKLGRYAALSRMERFRELKVDRLLEITLEEIRAGKFAREWTGEQMADFAALAKLERRYGQDDLWEFEQQTLEMMQG